MQASHTNRKNRTLARLIAETYTDNETKFYVLCDAGNGSAFGEAGQAMVYDDDAAARYGHIALKPTLAHMSNDRVECNYASEWQQGDNGYSYQVRF